MKYIKLLILSIINVSLVHASVLLEKKIDVLPLEQMSLNGFSIRTIDIIQDEQAVKEILHDQDVWQACEMSYVKMFLLYQPEDILVVCKHDTHTICGIIIYDSKKFDIGYVDLLAIHKDYRNQGLATFLLQYIERYYSHNKVLTLQLTVLSDNQQALRWYYNRGFQQVQPSDYVTSHYKSICATCSFFKHIANGVILKLA